MRWAGQVARMGDRVDPHIISVGKTVGRRPLGRRTCRMEYNIKMNDGEWTELILFRIGTSGGLFSKR